MAMTKLLLADDSITIQKVVELVLAEEGFEIKATSNGEEALEALASFNPDIVLADIEMPKMNGYQLCEKIKAGADTRNIPVLLLAGAFEPIDEELASSVGAAGYVIKPFESQDLLEKLNATLAARPAAEALAEEVLAVEEVVEAVPAGEEDLWAMEGISPALVEGQPEAGEEVVIAEEAVEEITLQPAEDAILNSGEAMEQVVVAEEAAIEEAPVPPERYERVEVAPVSSEDVRDAIKASFSENVSRALAEVDIRELVINSVMPEIRAMVEKTVSESVPHIINGIVKEVAAEVAGSIKKDVEKVIWETVPDLAESAIRKEIEAIKSGF